MLLSNNNLSWLYHSGWSAGERTLITNQWVQLKAHPPSLPPPPSPGLPSSRQMLTLGHRDSCYTDPSSSLRFRNLVQEQSSTGDLFSFFGFHNLYENIVPVGNSSRHNGNSMIPQCTTESNKPTVRVKSDCCWMSQLCCTAVTTSAPKAQTCSNQVTLKVENS